MKRFLLLCFLVPIGFSPLFSQIDIQTVLRSDILFKGQDMTDSTLDLSVHIDVSNFGNEVANLKWEIVTSGDTCMDEWGLYVCDNNFCYDETVPTNYDPDGTGINFPSVVNPGETYDFVLHVVPYMFTGCCTVHIEFSTIEEPDVIIESLELEIHVNSQECSELVAVEDPYITALSIFPNPTNGKVQFSNLDRIETVRITDVFGNSLLRQANANSLNIEGLKEGMYFLSALDAKGNLLKTFKLIKN